MEYITYKMMPANTFKTLFDKIKATSALGAGLTCEKDLPNLCRAVNIALLQIDEKINTVVFLSSGTSCWAELAVLRTIQVRFNVLTAAFCDIEFKDTDPSSLIAEHMDSLRGVENLDNFPEYKILLSNDAAKESTWDGEVLYVAIHYQNIGSRTRFSSYGRILSIHFAGEFNAVYHKIIT